MFTANQVPVDYSKSLNYVGEAGGGLEVTSGSRSLVVGIQSVPPLQWLHRRCKPGYRWSNASVDLLISY